MKVCCRCKKSKEDSKFSIKRLKTKIVLQSSCKKCHSIYRKEHYEKINRNIWIRRDDGMIINEGNTYYF